MNLTHPDLIENTVVVPVEYNGHQISKAECRNLLNKCDTQESDDLMGRLLELDKKGEIYILLIRNFNIFGNEIPVNRVIPASMEFTIIPGYLPVKDGDRS